MPSLQKPRALAGPVSSVWLRGLSLGAGLVATAVLRPPAAGAEDETFRLLREPTPYTDVVDAFDGDDPFDLNARLSYQRRSDRGRIRRERATDSGRRLVDIAKSEQTVSQLDVQIDVGLYRDLMAFMRLPLIISDARKLTAIGGERAREERLNEPGDYQGQLGPLFELPFTSPTRAGFDYIAFGGAWGILNQQRTDIYPTWVVLLEGRRAVGTPLRPCIDVGGTTTCGTRGDRDGDGQVDQGTALGMRGERSGSSQGVSGVTVETRLSYRYRYLEPYVGTGFSIDWPSTARRYFMPGGDLRGMINTLPSRQTWAVIGSTFIPWEHRGRYQRFAIDLQLDGRWLSEGHEYSHLYDALGTSTHQALAAPQYEGYTAEGTPTTRQKVPFYGLTDVQSRLRYGLRAGLEMQAARYVRFVFGTGVWRVTNHAITFADPCNSDARDPTRSIGPSGTSCSPGIVNPAHRAVFDGPGRRFWMVGETMFDLYAAATAQF